MKFLLDEKLFLTHIMGKTSLNGFTKSRWLSVFILPANRNKNAYPSLQASTIFQFTSLKGQIFLYFGENQEKQNIVTVLIFFFWTKTKTDSKLNPSKLPWTYKLWPLYYIQTCYVFWHFLRNILASSLPSSSSSASLSSVLPFLKTLFFPVSRPRWLIRKLLLLILLLRTNIS